jgi:hypothetical protein
MHAKTKNMSILSGVVLALFGIIYLAYLTIGNSCFGQCTHDQRCHERCVKRNFCPFSRESKNN